MGNTEKAISRAERRAMVRRIDKALLDIYPEHTLLVKWWRKLPKEEQDELKTNASPPERYVRLVELDKAVVSLLRDRRKLKGDSKHPNGIKETLRRHRD